MADRVLGKNQHIDVAIIGGGPSGLSAATELKHLGVGRVVILERERQAGGIPRHLGHPPFGMREFTRVLTGPQYAKRLVSVASEAGVEIHLSTTVIEARPAGELLITTNDGMQTIKARRVIYATGVRETPRSARLISGSRPQGVMNTASLQSLVYLNNSRPFQRPVIVGSELVSYSAILTCRHAKIKPAAMIEERAKSVARWPSSLFPRLLGIPLHLNTRIVGILGDKKLRAIVVEDANANRREIACDGLILTGRFRPESSLALCGHLKVDVASNGPVVDQFGRCSDPAYFATGNVLRPVETAGWCWNEGRRCAGWVAEDLAGRLAGNEKEQKITAIGRLIKFSIPHKIALPYTSMGMEHLQLRFSDIAKGTLVASNANGIFWQQNISVHPERRYLVPLRKLVEASNGENFTVQMNDGRRVLPVQGDGLHGEHSKYIEHRELFHKSNSENHAVSGETEHVAHRKNMTGVAGCCDQHHQEYPSGTTPYEGNHKLFAMRSSINFDLRRIDSRSVMGME